MITMEKRVDLVPGIEKRMKEEKDGWMEVSVYKGTH